MTTLGITSLNPKGKTQNNPTTIKKKKKYESLPKICIDTSDTTTAHRILYRIGKADKAGVGNWGLVSLQGLRPVTQTEPPQLAEGWGCVRLLVRIVAAVGNAWNQVIKRLAILRLRWPGFPAVVSSEHKREAISANPSRAASMQSWKQRSYTTILSSWKLHANYRDTGSSLWVF